MQDKKVNWDIPMYPIGITANPAPASMAQLLKLGESVENSARPLGDCQVAVAGFGLTNLAYRQARAFDLLWREGLHDQAIPVARSIYETLLNLRYIFVHRNDFVAGRPWSEVTPVSEGEAANEAAHRQTQAEKFWEFRRATNKKFLDRLEEYRSSAARRIKNGENRPTDSQVAVELATEIARISPAIEDGYDEYVKNFGTLHNSKYKAPKTWSGLDITSLGVNTGVDFGSQYAWCCNFSHSNSTAVRLLLCIDEVKGQYSCGSSEYFTKGVDTFAIWCFAWCLQVCFECLTGFTEERDELRKFLKSAPTKSGA